MAIFERVSGYATHRRFLEAAWRGAEVPGTTWFVARFVIAATAVVNTWGPRWTRRRVLGKPLGVWLLGLVWMALPAGFIAPLAFRLVQR